MRTFFLGFVTAIVLFVLVGFCYLRFGLVDPRADIAPSTLESRTAMPSVDAAVARRASVRTNPIQPTEENLAAGMRIYQINCARCHGDIGHPHGGFADAFYPRAPQFMEDAPDMPENENDYIIQHGIRLSGMPAWKQILSEREIWQTAAFLSHMDKLSPQSAAAWRSMAGEPSPESPAPGPARDKTMEMPMH